MFCEKCGAELKENAKFCGKCGEVVEEIVITVQPDTSTTTDASATTVASAQPDTSATTVASVATAAPIHTEAPVQTAAPTQTAAPVQTQQFAPVASTPYQAAPVAQPQPAAPVPPMRPVPPILPQKRKIPAYATAISVFLCILIFVSAVWALAVVGLRSSISKGSIRKQFNNELSEFEIDGEPLADILYDSLSDDGIIDSDIRRSEFKEFLEESTFDDFFAEKFSGLLNDVIDGTSKTEISKREVIDLFDDNEHILEDMGISIDDEFKREAAEGISDYFDFEEVLDEIDRDEESFNIMETVRTAVSAPMLILALAFILVCASLVFGLCKNRIASAFRHLFVTFLSVSAVFGVLSLAMKIFVGNLLESDDAALDYVIMLVSKMMTTALIIALVTAVLLIAGYVACRIYENTKNKKKAA